MQVFVIPVVVTTRIAPRFTLPQSSPHSHPTVSVTVNGASQDEAVFISPNNKVENTGRYEVDYGDGITITAKDGYEITAVTVDGEEVESVDGTSYTLTDVIEPHDIVVTVEKTGGEPDLPQLKTAMKY